jgi:hypothetical protein
VVATAFAGADYCISGVGQVRYRITGQRGRPSAYRALVDRSGLIRHLPLALAVALRLREAGADDGLIAAALAIEPDGVAPLLELARAKLDRLARDGPGGEARDHTLTRHPRSGR